MRTLYALMLAALFFVGLSLAGCDSAITPSDDPVISEQAGQTQSSAKRHKIDICHKRGDQGYVLLAISAKAEPAHRAHGDGLVGDEVPGRPGFMFDENCVPVSIPVPVPVPVPSPSPCPCFDADDLDAVLWTDWFAPSDEEALAARPTDNFASVCINPASSFCGGTYQCALVTDESSLFLDISGEEALACQALIVQRVASQDPPPACVGSRCPGATTASKMSKATRSHFRGLD